MAGLIVAPDALREILSRGRTVAVLGAHSDPSRPAHYVPAYLSGQGYRVLPVNPRLVGQSLWGEPVRANLAEIADPVDILDVFRRSADLPDHVAEIIALHPAVVWFQSGIRNDAVATRLVAAGIDVVQDRCTLAEHRAFGLAPHRP